MQLFVRQTPDVEYKFESVSKDFTDAVFVLSQAEGRWEVYDRADLATLVAHQENNWA